MDEKIMIVSPDEQQEVAVQDREQYGTNTDEKVSKNVDVNKRKLHFVFRAITFPTVESKGEIVSESFVSVEASSLGENSCRRFRWPNTTWPTWNNQQPAHEGLHRYENRRDEQKSKLYAKEHSRSKKRVQFDEAVYVFSELKN